MTETPAVEAYGRNQHSEIQMGKMDASLDLPQDMIAEILFKLPVKILLRFKTVCKSWLALISTPQFEKMRREVLSYRTGFSMGYIITFKIYPTSGLLMLRNLMQPILPDELMPVLGLTKCSECVGPYNGVYLVRDCYGNTALWNHANMSYKILSQGNSCETDPEVVTYGFGYEDLLEGRFDFLVMKLHREGSVSETKAPKLYRLSTGQWKDLKPLPKEYNCRWISFSYRTVSINGIFYWLGYGYGESPNFIILFDTRSETFGKLDLPHIHQQSEEPRLLLSCYRSDGNELLSFLLIIAAQNYEIWVLRDHKSWVKESTCKGPIKEWERKAVKHPNANDEWFGTFLCDESLVSLGCKVAPSCSFSP